MLLRHFCCASFCCASFCASSRALLAQLLLSHSSLLALLSHRNSLLARQIKSLLLLPLHAGSIAFWRASSRASCAAAAVPVQSLLARQIETSASAAARSSRAFFCASSRAFFCASSGLLLLLRNWRALLCTSQASRRRL